MKNVMITGVSGGIGRVAAQWFINKGYHVYGIDLIDDMTLDGAFTYYKVDVSNNLEVEALYSRLIKQGVSIDVLINNAAVAYFCKPLKEVSSDEINRVLDVNIKGYVHMAKAFINHHKHPSFGRIINIASTRHQQNQMHWDLYGASKGAVVALTTSLCVSLMNTPITVNTISPGWIETQDYNTLSESDHKQHPSGRVGKPQDIARALLFLCEDDNDFINGANLTLDGGMTKRMFYYDDEPF